MFRIILITLLGICGGCAHLEIRIDAYKGDLTPGADSQLSEAVGAAAGTNVAAIEFKKRLDEKPTIYNDEIKHDEPVVDEVIDAYTNLKILALAQAYNSAKPEDLPTARRQLAMALIQYSEVCISCGERIGFPEESTPF